MILKLNNMNFKDFKYFIGYKDAEKITPLCIFRPRHKIDFDKSRCMYFLIKEEKFSDKYNEILKKVRNDIKKN